ncbi:DUF1330 domain-containing protein [Shimia sp.]|uniref:DUF1330 domain-containing protein n=1 Tax=Shimia sp. TaxID=1954381 RepID=UPI003B8C0CC9
MTKSAKAYWIANVTVTDPEAYQGYQALAPEAFAKYGARFLARGDAETLEGTQWQRRVIIEFATMQQAQECYNSPEYRAARAQREKACIADIALIEGLS